MSEADDVLLNTRYDDRYKIDKDLVSNVHRLVFFVHKNKVILCAG